MILQNSAIYAFDLQKNITYPQKRASINFNMGVPSSKNVVYITHNSFTFLTGILPAFKEGNKNNPIIKIITLSNELTALNETQRTVDYMMANSYDNPFIAISNISDSICYVLSTSEGKYRQIHRISLSSQTTDIIHIPNMGIVPYFYGIEVGSGGDFYLYGNLNSNFFISNYNNIGKQLYTSRYDIREQIQKVYGIHLFRGKIYCALDTTKDNNEIFKLCVCNKDNILEELDFEGTHVSLLPYYEDFILCSYKHANNLEFIILNEKSIIQKTFKVENVKGLIDYKIVDFDKKLYLFILYKERINLYELSGDAFKLIGSVVLDGFYSTIGFTVINTDTCFVGLGYPVFIKKTNLIQQEIAVVKFKR